MRPAGAVVAEGVQSPTGLQVGLGVRPGSTETMFEEGQFQNTGNPYDVAIEGDGFFKILLPDGSTGYTRDGSFKMDSQGKLVNSSGYALQPEIVIPADATNVSVGADGTVSVLRGGQQNPTTVGKIQLSRFINPAGLTNIGGNVFKPTAASGDRAGRHGGPSRLRDIGAGHLRNVQRPGRAGDGQHDRRPARLRSQLEGYPGVRRYAEHRQPTQEVATFFE